MIDQEMYDEQAVPSLLRRVRAGGWRHQWQAT
jgi:hypothetical protein